ncbi:MAG: hypothetical protein KDD51_01815 [Bdellovibrionales bacterium]|nr:hypothetical protein [Bdellovibrionales bacterium]
MSRFVSLVFLSLLAVTHPVFAGVDELKKLVDESLATDVLDERQAGWIAQIENYGAVTPVDQWRVKYMKSHWRYWMVDRLVKHAKPSTLGAVATTLDKLRYNLSPKYMDQLLSVYEATEVDAQTEETLAKVIATHGDPIRSHFYLSKIQTPLTRQRADKLAGPDRPLNISPMDPSVQWQHTGWLGQDSQSLDEYEHEDGRVTIRGVSFQAGDVVVIDHNKFEDGLNIAMSIPRSQATHSGVVVFVHHDGKVYPAVFEINVGLRLVPLQTYVSPAFSSHVEVLRSDRRKQASEDEEKQLSDLALRMLDRQMGYDFNAIPVPKGGYDEMLKKGQLCVMCSSLVDVVEKSCGVDHEIPMSLVAPGVVPNLHAVGLEKLAKQRCYLSPTDLLLTKSLRHVGTIDNGFLSNVLREFVMGGEDVNVSMGYLISKKDMDVQKILDSNPLATTVYLAMDAVDPDRADHDKKGVVSSAGRWMIRNTGRAALNSLIGLNERTRIHAPPYLLPVMMTLGSGSRESVSYLGSTLPSGFPEREAIPAKGEPQVEFEPLFRVLGSQKAFDIQEAEANSEVRRAIQAALSKAGVLGWFKDR